MGIRSEVVKYGLCNPLVIPAASVERARSVKTRLAKLEDATQRDLIDWGYVIADTALCRWVYPTEAAPAQLPAT